MPVLYNCRIDGDQWRITKFNSDFNVEASYLCTEAACECPAGHRPSCRHRQMLPKFIQRGHIGDEWFWDHDRGGWVQGTGIEESAEVSEEQLVASAALLQESSKGLTIATQREVLIDDSDAAWSDAQSDPRTEPSPKPSPSPTIRRRV